MTPYEELLGLIPDTAETRSYVLISDYALMRYLFDIPLPGPDADKSALEEYMSAFFVGGPDRGALPQLIRGPWISGYPEYVEVSFNNRRYLGFDFRDAQRSVLAGVPPGRLEVLQGQFSPATTEAALNACSGECTPPDSQEEYQGVTFYSWGQDFEANPQKRLVPPAFDQLGRGGRIAVQPNHVFRALGTDDMKSMIDASLDKLPSLLDREDYRLLAQGMSELKAYGMFFTDQTQGLDEMVKALALSQEFGMIEPARLRAQVVEREPVTLRRYLLFGTGVGKDDQGAYTALVLVHADEAAATDNESLLQRRIGHAERWRIKRPWADYFDADNIEVLARGRVLLAKLRPAEGRQPNWIEWVSERDPLLLHE